MTVEPLGDAEFERVLVGSLPHLKAFATALCGCRERAKDLVQETVLRGWQSRSDFRADCDIRPWLFKILRNVHIMLWRKSAAAVTECIDEIDETNLKASTAAVGSGFFEIEQAMAQLPDEQREILLLIVAEGLSYEDAAMICGCAVGTVKSRLSRARERLSGLLTADQILLPSVEAKDELLKRVASVRQMQPTGAHKKSPAIPRLHGALSLV